MYIEMLKEKYRTIGFVGSGVSNMPLIMQFAKNGFDVTLRDRKDKSLIKSNEELERLGVKFVTGDDHLNGITEEVLFLSPVVHADLPQIQEAKKNGTRITTEMQEFVENTKATVIGITGSDGKTTTSTLTAKLLESAGKRVFLGGNIGENLLVKIDEMNSSDFAVVELSSFQLMKMDASPDICVITNVSPNHLDWHKDMAEYTEAKTRIFQGNRCKLVVLNKDNALTASMKPKVKTIYFSGTEMLNNGISYNSEGVYVFGEKYIDDNEIILPGIHNRANYSAALGAVSEYVSKRDASKLAREFGGVEHRLELVRTLNGVKYYNSSIDTSPTRTAAALNSFKSPVIVIAGGYDKHIPLEPLGELFTRCTKGAVLMGATADKIEEILKTVKYPHPLIRVKTMDEAVNSARSLSSSGDSVVLSPAAASFDLYENFAVRGNDFKDKVKKLQEETIN